MLHCLHKLKAIFFLLFFLSLSLYGDGYGASRFSIPPPTVKPAAPAAPAVSAKDQKRAEGLQYLERAKTALERGRLIEAREYYKEAQKRIPEEKSFKEFGEKLVLAETEVKEAGGKRPSRRLKRKLSKSRQKRPG